MIDVLNEALLTFADASKMLPGRPSISSIWRWRTSGIRGQRLESVLIGGTRYTSREALQRFIAATTAAADGETVTVPDTPKRRSRELRRAEKRAAELGI
jgi:hypothetical protein